MFREIVLVEDDEVIRENYIELLSYEGFNVIAYSNKEDALAAFKLKLPDLDISLEDEREGGFQLCLYLRQQSLVLPILFLTSHGSEVDKISGFRLGADDYLTKDISIEFLIVRTEALLRRYDNFNSLKQSAINSEANVSQQDKIQIDLDRLLISWNNHVVELTLTQFWIVQELLAPPRQVKSYR